MTDSTEQLPQHPAFTLSNLVRLAFPVRGDLGPDHYAELKRPADLGAAAPPQAQRPHPVKDPESIVEAMLLGL